MRKLKTHYSVVNKAIKGRVMLMSKPSSLSVVAGHRMAAMGGGMLLFIALLVGCGGNEPPTNAVSAVTEHPTTTVSAATMDAITADMGLNEASLLHAPVSATWPIRATIGMGGAPRGDATPSWWTPANLAYKSSATWNGIGPWFVIYPGTAHAATNVRVKIYKMEIYLLSKSTNKWSKLDASTGNPVWAGNYDFDLITGFGRATPRKEPDGHLSYKLDNSFHPIHGGPGVFPIVGDDVAAVFGTLTSELILDNPSGVDDRGSAQILVTSGADYYPDVTASVASGSFLPMRYIPQVAQSRFGLAKTAPRTHRFATIDVPGAVVSTGSVYSKSGGKVAIPVAQFVANPPPGL